MTKEKACLIIHPKSKHHLTEILAVLQARWETTMVETRFAGHGTQLAANAARQGIEWIIAYGGDGILNEVINGSMQVESPPVIGALPGGTVNQWVHETGFPGHPIEAARALTKSMPRKIDLGYIEVKQLDFPDQEHADLDRTSFPSIVEHNISQGYYFLLVAGLGMDAKTIQSTSETAKAHYGQLAFIFDWLRLLPGLRPFPLQVRWPNGQRWKGATWEVLVSNTRRYTRLGNLIPEAHVNDGLLDIRIFSHSSPIHGLLRPYQVHNFTLTLPASVPLEIDGSSLPLVDMLPPESAARLLQTENTNEVQVIYHFQSKRAALQMAIPPEYHGPLFKQQDAACYLARE